MTQGRRYGFVKTIKLFGVPILKTVFNEESLEEQDAEDDRRMGFATHQLKPAPAPEPPAEEDEDDLEDRTERR